jgi:hypothetical protein
MGEVITSFPRNYCTRLYSCDLRGEEAVEKEEETRKEGTSKGGRDKERKHVVVCVILVVPEDGPFWVEMCSAIYVNKQLLC